MKATGIVRRIDDLGRVVIPKEIRRTLRIRESDPLEIFTGSEGEIVLKKYSPLGELSVFAKQYTDSLAQTAGCVTAITDRDQFISVSGGMKSLLNKPISKELEEKLDNRETVQAEKGDRNFVMVAEDDESLHEVIVPILCEGDVIGSVVLLSADTKGKMNEAELKMAQAAAGFLGRQMEQ